MRMDLIQPFINAADAVLAQALRCRTQVEEVAMDEKPYQRHGVAAMVQVSGDIEGYFLLDADVEAAIAAAASLSGSEVKAGDPIIGEAMLELANQVIGNAVTTLNNQGFSFRVHPPVLHEAALGQSTTEDTEALMMCFQTSSGKVFMNIALRYVPQATTQAAGV